ncbi:MAG: sulfurtransferase [Gammaproteobacteria bacterium]|nr:sulfurtransferase [Gammaproteobacteria bacterium]
MSTALNLPPWLVDTDWLGAHLEHPQLRLFDCAVQLLPDPPRMYRIESGRRLYDAGHIPGAVFLDLLADLSAPDPRLAFMLPDAAHFAAAMSRYGVDDDSRVVLYASSGVLWATRVFWMLRAYGFDRAAVLDGGLKKWQAEGRPLSDAPASYPAASFLARPRPGLFSDQADMRAALDAPGTVVLNALSPELFRGTAPVHYGRPGRIAGSRNLFYQTLLDPDTGTFLPRSELAARLRRCGALDAPAVKVYCGGGIAATVDAFALAMLGHERVDVYDGSLSEWANDPSAPMETG